MGQLAKNTFSYQMVGLFHDIAVLFLYVACIQLSFLANSKIKNRVGTPCNIKEGWAAFLIGIQFLDA